jgi:hypothetical protein
MTDTQHPASLAAALADLQTRLPRIAKDKTAKVYSQRTGKTHSYDYADLATVSEKILPMLGVLGLSFMAFPDLTDDGKFCLRYLLQHSPSGDRESGRYPLPATGTPQELGSAITYARRYCLCAVTGVAPDNEDDDALAAEPRAAYDTPPCPVCQSLWLDCGHRNLDGSLSRSRTSDEEKAAAGVMTSGQHAEHTQLAKLEQARPAERLDATPADDPWYAGGLPPEDQPGSADGKQKLALVKHAAAKGLMTPDQRHARWGELLGLEKPVETSALSMLQAALLIKELKK